MSRVLWMAWGVIAWGAAVSFTSSLTNAGIAWAIAAIGSAVIFRPRARRPILHDKSDVPERSAKLIAFEYCDADGVITEREVVNWIDDGLHVEGFCLLRRANRTFRKDRIIRWIEPA